MRKYLMIISLILTGCATTTALLPIEYQFKDVPQERRVKLTYQNASRSTMCLLPEVWPNEGGKINQASDKVYLVVGNERFPIEDFNTGYCPQGCAIRVAPGEQVSAFISYKDFNLPDRLINNPKSLEFSPVAFRCSSK
jgi:hypothetical protein